MSVQIVTKQFEIDRKDYLKASWSRGLAKNLSGVALIGVGTTIGVLGFDQRLALGVVIGFLVMLLCVPLSLYSSGHRNAFRPVNPRVFEPRTMEFDDGFVRIATVSGMEGKVPWQFIQHAEWKSGMTMLFLNNLVAYFVPDSAFQNDTDRLTFIGLVSEHTKWKGQPHRAISK